MFLAVVQAILIWEMYFVKWKLNTFSFSNSLNNITESKLNVSHLLPGKHLNYFACIDMNALSNLKNSMSHGIFRQNTFQFMYVIFVFFICDETFRALAYGISILCILQSVRQILFIVFTLFYYALWLGYFVRSFWLCCFYSFYECYKM